MMKKIVCLGDSLTYGFGSSSRDAWPAFAQTLTGISMINKGINGETSAELLCRFYEDVVGEQPDACVIMGGANDILLGHPVEAAVDNIREILKKAQAYHIPVILGIPVNIDPIAIKDNWYCCFLPRKTWDMFCQLGQMLKECSLQTGETKVWILDFQTEYECRMKRKYGDKPIYIDGVHPTRDGYHMLGRIFADFAIEKGWVKKL